MKKLLIFLAMVALFVPVLVFSEEPVIIPPIPHLINYQGMLTDNSGIPLTGSFDIIFKIYNDASAGTKRWEETQSGVTVTNGLFNVILGSVTPINLNFDENYWLDITVGGEHMPSRLKFVSVGFAYRAWKADTANYASSVSGGSHNHDADYVNVIGPDSIRYTGSTNYALRVKAYSGDGISVFAPYSGAGDGIFIDSAGDNGIEINDVTNYGIWMDDIHDDGIHMTDVTGYGIYLDDVGDQGIYIDSVNLNGLYIRKASYGVYVGGTKPGYDGVWVNTASDDGLYVSTAGDDGLYVNTAKNGVHIQHADTGVYIRDNNYEGIVAYGDQGAAELYSNSGSYWALKVHAYNNLSTEEGLYVYGTGHITGGWSKSVPGKSGDIPAFGVFSSDMDLVVSGTGILVNGKAQITFEPEFNEAISTDIPVKVVLTAQGAPSGLLYVESKSNQGFTVNRLEVPGLEVKSDNITFDWIAIARQKGYEQRPKVHMPPAEEWSTQRQTEQQPDENLLQEQQMQQQIQKAGIQRESEKREGEREKEGDELE